MVVKGLVSGEPIATVDPKNATNIEQTTGFPVRMGLRQL